MRVGLHARDDYTFVPADIEVIRRARIESLKTMSFTGLSEYEKARAANPQIQFIVRLHHKDEIGSPGQGGMPSPADFVAVNRNRIDELHAQFGIRKFEIHNEPNHTEGKEG